MSCLPPRIVTALAPFAELFSRRVWVHVQVLLMGAILAPAQRTVAAALRVTGRAQGRQFHRYHRVLSRAAWSELAVGRVLLGLLVAAFAPTGPLLFGIDETLERRRGQRIAAKGIYRDPVRSSHGQFVKASGRRWVCLMLLVPIPWVGRVWALPFLTVLAPSERYHRARGQRHKTLLDWARQMVRLLRRWYPQRTLVVVADSTYAALAFLAAASAAPVGATLITRLRLDAALSAPPPPAAHRRGRPRLKGERLPTLAQRRDDPATVWTPLHVAGWYGRQEQDVEIASGTAVWYHSGKSPLPLRWVLLRDPQGTFAPQALRCTTLDLTPERILAWFVQRWQLEVTLEECRAHLGLETQRQWSDRAIARTTPALLSLFSLVTLLAQRLLDGGACPTRTAAWYAKTDPTFSDTLALVRRYLWTQTDFRLSPATEDGPPIPAALADHLADLLAYAA